MTTPIYIPPPVPQPTSVVQDTPCRKCGYNLRGLPIDGRVALLILGIRYLFMLGRFEREFKEQAALARQAWPTAPATPTP